MSYLKQTVIALAALAVATTSAFAQSWSRPVTMVVPFTAGTTSDIVGRALVDHLAKAIGQPVLIDNRGGAAGNIGAAAVAKARPDGHTILLATTAQIVTNKFMYKDMTFDPQRDLIPIALIGNSPVMIVAGPHAAVKSMKELIDYSKANPGKLNVGYNGVGLLGHITGELLQAQAGIKMVPLYYRGSGSIITDLIGGHIDIAMNSMGAYVPYVKTGELRALAIASKQRWSVLPDVPTAAESGMPGFEASVWYALFAPAGTPADMIAKLNAAVNTYLKSDSAVAVFDTLGVQAAGGSPADLDKYIAVEIEKWGPVIKSAGIEF